MLKQYKTAKLNLIGKGCLIQKIAYKGEIIFKYE